ncbi:hypothetical protein DH2020_004907 [Rehmannia glutinosa]|uniref:F-box domain-containing protein n=1 Tax=Rehmannia glutinosa TaxID=99300 RepID=A0ABR0XQR7_REHGL
MAKQAAKRRRKEEDGSIISMDRISELPQHILQHILSFLSQREAIQTCVLSKSWRYLGSTRPRFRVSEEYGFKGNKETFLAFLDKTLQGYNDQKLCIREFIVWMSMVDSESVSLLEKWLPMITLNMGVKILNLKFLSEASPYFDVPSIVFEAGSLQKLYLGRCKLNQNSSDKVLFKHLQTLDLSQVYIADETFDKIISSCPLIEDLGLHGCEGLKTIKVNKLHKYLKDFDFFGYELYKEHEDDTSIEIDAPIEAIKIEGCRNWFHHHNYYFSNLKYLCLNKVRLSTKSFDYFSRNFPCLEELELYYCYGFKNSAIVIDAPNIVKFEYRGDMPQSISFTTTFTEWKSTIVVLCDAFLNCLFRVCRPRNISQCWYLDAHNDWQRKEEKLIEFLVEILLIERDMRQHFWRQDLEEVSVEVFDENGKQWHPVQGTGLSEYQFYQRIRFRLKWRELEG